MLNSFFNYKNRITGEVISETEFWYGALLGKIHAEDFEIILPDFPRESDPKQAAESEQREPLYVNRLTGEVMTLDEAMNYVGERYRTFRKLFVPENEAENISGEEWYLNKNTSKVGALHDFYKSDMSDEEFFELLDNLIPFENLPEFTNVENWMLFRGIYDSDLALACFVFHKNSKSAHWKIYNYNPEVHFWFEVNDIHGKYFTTDDLIEEMYFDYEFIKVIPTESGSEHKPSEAQELIDKLQAAHDLMRDYNLI